MSSKKLNKDLKLTSSNKFELEPIMNFQEIPLDVAIKMLKDSDIIVSEEQASEILQFFHTLVKITLKEFLTPQD